MGEKTAVMAWPAHDAQGGAPLLQAALCPRRLQVAAFAGRQVLEVACGVWHTAAIVAEPEGVPHQQLAAGLQHSPGRLEGAGAADAAAGADPAPAVASGIPPASPVHHGAVHHRNNSTSSAFSEVRACGTVR